MNNINIFLSGRELEVISSTAASIHLKKTDSRYKILEQLLKSGNLSLNIWSPFQIITVNPYQKSYYDFFQKEEWYLIPSIIYTGRCSFNGYEHFSFSYRLRRYYTWERNCVRLLTTYEISKYKLYQMI